MGRFFIYVTITAKVPLTAMSSLQNAIDYATRLLKSDWVIRDHETAGYPIVGSK